MPQFLRRRHALLILLVVLGLLVLRYTPTLLTQITGDGDQYLNDVGEFQVALNIWGTVHATGYPLFLMIGNVVVAVLRTLGAGPAFAPSLYALLWGLVALSIFYTLVLRLTNRIVIAAVATLLLGFTRSVWVHNVIAEEYAMNSAIELTLFAIAVWPPGITSANVRRRVLWLALIGGLGVFHHRTAILMAPGLIWAVWPELWRLGRRAWPTIAAALVIGLLGFLPYLYLPIRAWAHADWVYGDPGTLSGFWDQITGKEAGHLTHLPEGGQAWLHDIGDTFQILLTELTPVPALVCTAGLLFALNRPRYRRIALLAILCSAGYLLFLFALHEVVKPQAVAMPIVILLVLGLGLGLNELAEVTGAIRWPKGSSAGLRSQSILSKAANEVVQPGTLPPSPPEWRRAGGEANPIPIAVLSLISVVLAIFPATAHYDYVYALTHRDIGLTMIALARQTPRLNGNAVFMLPWGPRFHAVAYSKYVTRENGDLELATHTAPFGVLAAQGKTIFTARDTLYQFPLNWWDAQIGHAYLSSPAAGLIAIQTKPEQTPSGTPRVDMANGVVIQSAVLCKTPDALRLHVVWGANRTPDRDLSVFVHLMAGDAVVAQADSSAPVYGWYPTTRWSSGEAISDYYELPRVAESTGVSFGLYVQKPSGEFKNFGQQFLPVTSALDC